MGKSPLDRLSQLQTGLAIAVIVAVVAGFNIPVEPFRLMLFVIAAIALLALLVSVAVGYAAQAVINALKNRVD